MAEFNDDGSVYVSIRENEVNENCCSITKVIDNRIVEIKNSGYKFDKVYDIDSEQKSLFEELSKPLIKKCLSGYNTAILAYGQTGSGKTYTMGTSFPATGLDDTVGLIPRTVQHLFDEIKLLRQNGTTVEVLVYNEDIFDLLDPKNKGTGCVKLQGCSCHSVSDEGQVFERLKEGGKSRMTAVTNMNIHSSRSHAIFSIIISQIKEEAGKATVETESKFHLVDLAGSERLSRTGATGDRVREAISINSGLLALGNVINALGDRSKRGGHIPYRDSKLTRLLQDSLGGNSYTVMIACVSPSDKDMSETISSLNYALRAKNIKNKVSLNQKYKSKNNSQLNNELKSLRDIKLLLTQQLEFYRSKCDYYEKKFGNDSFPDTQTSGEVGDHCLVETAINLIESGSHCNKFLITVNSISEESIQSNFMISDLERNVSASSVKTTDNSETSSDLIHKDLTREQRQDKLIEVNANIEVKDGIIRELEGRLREFEEMRDLYEHQIESLNAKLSDLMEKEKAEVEFLQKQSKTGEEIENVRSEYQLKIKDLKNQLKDVCTQQRSYQQKIIEKEQVDNQLSLVKQELIQLKSAKVSLSRFLGKEIIAGQKKEREYLFKIGNLAKESSKKDHKINNLTRDVEKISNVLKRKMEELEIAKKINRQKAPCNIQRKTSTHVLPSYKFTHLEPISLQDMNKTYIVQDLCSIPDSPAVSRDAKNKWSLIEKQIHGLMAKKETLLILKKGIEKSIQDRKETSHEIALLREKLKLKKCVGRVEKRTQEKIQNLEEKLESLQLSIENDQKQVAELEIYDSNDIAVELFKDSHHGEGVYLFRHLFDTLLRNIDDLVAKTVELKEAEFQKTIPKKRGRKANNHDQVIEKDSKRRKTALPSELRESLLSTPFGQKYESKQNRPVTRNMAKKQQTDAFNTDHVSEDGHSASSESKENIVSKKRHLLK